MPDTVDKHSTVPHANPIAPSSFMEKLSVLQGDYVQGIPELEEERASDRL